MISNIIKHKSRKYTPKMSYKIKKELEILTELWFNSFSKKQQINSKKNVKKFINTLKKKCKHK